MKDKKPVVSVVVPSYNEASYIGRLLEALSKQEFDQFEVVVSDAQSKDKTGEVINSYKDSLEIKAVLSPPRGPAAGRNEGAKKARGEWLLFLDADVDIDDTGFIGTLLHEADKFGWQTASTSVRIRSASFGERFGLWLHHHYLRLLAHTKHPVAPGFCILTKRELFEANGGFDEELWLAEDYDYVSRVAKYGFGFVESTYYYVDLRRFNEGGKIKVFILSIIYEIYRFTHGFKIKGDPFKYKFGHHKERE